MSEVVAIVLQTALFVDIILCGGFLTGLLGMAMIEGLDRITGRG